jgi:uracil phosphoribosyltransferase
MPTMRLSGGIGRCAWGEPGRVNLDGRGGQGTLMDRVVELNHPLAAHHLARLRDRHTSAGEFRALVRRLTVLLCCEALRDLSLCSRRVQTPLTETEGQELRDRFAVVPILRAGLGMIDPVLELVPEAEVWVVGLYRDEQTLEPVEYYRKLPADNPPPIAMVVDPMLATGGSAKAAIDVIRRWGVERIKLLSLIAAPEGLELVISEHEEVQVYVCSVDEGLDSRGFIVPGLGDAGDRIFNTHHPLG